ncbi:cytochrome c maturation protein CcmE [Pelagibaculum spongiae]|uniref:Cytochrome c-type biogenesis protein CcmE n=1 Tax=Pelagibaculum spongiae TaxID=2080658 RepID=A0A2V1GQW1_9GAMM|nr:cytochrome c maturation protein CcmE [Pelagibaculum spongiae]PVZ66679.1 cytochrome c maturation protein CcmE [Pelagibaculum spongiae]
MTPKRKKRLTVVMLILFGVGTSVALLLQAFQQGVNLFYTPQQVVQGEAPKGAVFRVGGVVVPDSVNRADDSLKVTFGLTDNKGTITVHYEGILPDLFREGQGIVSLGSLDGKGGFRAQEVLAKHDENYMAPEVVEALGESHIAALKAKAEAAQEDQSLKADAKGFN